MTTPATLKDPLTIYQGATFHKRFIWQSASGSPIDLTGCTARMQVRAKVTDPAVLIELTTEDGGLTLGGATGTIDLEISDEDTRVITSWKGGVWDLLITFPSGETYRIVEGTIVVSPGVTRG